MTANKSLERRVADHYANEPPLRAPDRVLLAALATIDTTHQRRGLFAPWRFTQMSTYAKVAAAVAVIAVIVVGYWQLAPKQGSSGGTVTPPPTLAATTAPTASPAPSGAYMPPALTETFTSAIHGLSVSYPTGWSAQAATEPWTDADPPQFGDPDGDMLSDPGRDDGHLFIAIASQPLGATSFDEWLTDYLAVEGCTRTGAILISGADLATDTSCDFVLASSDGRAYAITLYVSNDDVDLRSFDSATWFDEVLATVELHPEDAVDEAPTASP